jgi:hypothetical protein
LGRNSFISFNPSSTGTYYLATRDFGNNSIGGYTASIWETPSLSIAGTNSQEGGVNSSISFEVTLSQPIPIPITVNFFTTSVTATSGLDYAHTNELITFLPNQTVVNITIVTKLQPS